ncbi:MAG: extracellular solute-binding protein [Chloroflexi bacterium]|nr:extracellular solute-binding protein [Chloroflexota bacterium]
MNGKTIGKATFVGIVCSILILLSCAPPQAPVPPDKAPGAAVAIQQQGWEQDWQKAIAAARQEGPLVIYVSGASAELRQEMTKGFKNKFGLDVEWLEGKSAELIAKILQERRAGLFIPDLIMGSTTRQQTILKPEGVLDPIKPLLVLPEVLDKKVWFGGDIAWVDNEKMYTINATLAPDYLLTINTSIVKPDDIKSYNDLLAPRWKGQITMLNPGGSLKPFSEILLVMGPDWWRKLVQQEPALTDNQRVAYEWVARGKYPIGILGSASVRQEFITAGAPMAKVIPKEGSFLGGVANATSLMNRAPRPNAAKVFVNWYLSKEGAALQSRVAVAQSARLDVPTDHLTPDSMRDPSATYVSVETEEFYMKAANDNTLALQIFAPLVK